MEIKYMGANNEILPGMEISTLPCALCLNLVDESIGVTFTGDDIDMSGSTSAGGDNGLMYWEIPQITPIEANALLDHIAPFAETIIYEYSIDSDYTEEPIEKSVQDAISQISRYVHDLELLET
jgi:hypothetical protein